MKENENRLKLGYDLKRHSKMSKKDIWSDASEAILASRKNRPEVNVSDISRNSKEGSKVIVPGKVLGVGEINHKVTVAAFAFSKEARAKIKASGQPTASANMWCIIYSPHAIIIRRAFILAIQPELLPVVP